MKKRAWLLSLFVLAAAGTGCGGGKDGATATGTSSSATVAVSINAQSADTVEVFINGQSNGTSTAAGALLAATGGLVAGENIITLRATKGSATVPFVLAQFAGQFGKLGTTNLWKAKAATSAEASGNGSWSTLAYDDSTWSSATQIAVAAPAGFPAATPALGIWTASALDTAVLLRLKFYLPAHFVAATPTGFGQNTTGGAGGTVVNVTTPAELKTALCGSFDAVGYCTDTTPRIIQIGATIDFTTLEGASNYNACLQMQCTAPMQSEYVLAVNGFCPAPTATIPVTIDTAGTTPLRVGSNKTILGVGSNAVIKGKGLKLDGGVSNVIVRNIALTDINPQYVWGGDALTIDNASNIWIDHNRFARIGRQMIVTGFGKASGVTISWNEFDGVTNFSATCNGTHYWTFLAVGANDTITLHDNWLHDTSGRGPKSGGYSSTVAMQIVNNYYQNVTGHAANPETTLSTMLIEGNYYKNVAMPVYIVPTNIGYAWAPVTAISAVAAASCTNSLNRNCELNVASPMPTSTWASWPMDTQALAPFSNQPNGAVLTPYPATEVINLVPHLAGTGHL